MKTTGKIIRTFALFLGVTAVLVSCQKDRSWGTNPAEPYRTIDRLTPEQEEMVQSMVNNINELAIYDEERQRVYKFDMNSREFSFADAGEDGWNFSDNEDVQWYGEPTGGGTLVIGLSAFGENSSSGSGNVIAGSSVLSIDYTFCFSASDEALGLDLFDFGVNIDGISMVLGIDGDFEALQNGDVDEDAEFTDFFHGFAMFFVYDDQAQGTYNIIDWFENYDGTPEDLSDNGFSYVLDFVNFDLYFSYDGEIDVDGGQMSFEGEYFSLLEFFTAVENYDDIDYAIVDGYGDMGCN
ncbi:MAG: hypothetical protein KDC12_02820 [Flavobacteriales bacterium]|nr:hypothetical protein [Flavobacteriales bacterium]